jgi:dihydroorotate dehydrogenase
MTFISTCNIIAQVNKSETGGLSGVPLKRFSLSALKTLRSHLPSSIPLIGCGGISSGADALEYAKAGASLVQVYTGFGYDGAGTCRRIKDQLVQSLEKEGMTWGEVVKRAVDELSTKSPEKRVRLDDVAASEASVNQLVEEAEELLRLLDRLGENMENDIGRASDLQS